MILFKYVNVCVSMREREREAAGGRSLRCAGGGCVYGDTGGWCAGRQRQAECRAQSQWEPCSPILVMLGFGRGPNISCVPLPAGTRCLHFPWHLLMIKVPVVYNYQFDKFRSSLLIIIISFHSARLREFNDNINNRRTTIRN